jgi:hypothetical protein
MSGDLQLWCIWRHTQKTVAVRLAGVGVIEIAVAGKPYCYVGNDESLSAE